MARPKTDDSRRTADRDLLIKNANVWNGNGFSKASILIEKGKITHLGRIITGLGVESFEASGLYALPGLIDVHVHLRDLRLSYKEDFATGTAAAAAGGFTTVLDMPNTLPPTDSPERLVRKQRLAAKRVYVNVGFHAAATTDPETVQGLAEQGAFSLKLYMPKPITPFRVDDDKEVRKLMEEARRIGLPVTVHAEETPERIATEKPGGFVALAKERGPILETRAVDRIALNQKSTHSPVHFCHLTLASSLKRVRSLSRSTSEVTPHHLLLSTKVLRRLGWKAWMVPPLRSDADRRELLTAASAGYCDIIASDHAPHAIGEKRRNLQESVPGVPGLETTLPLVLTLVNKGILTLSGLVRMLSENPAKTFNLRSKAKIHPGYDGDLVLVKLKRKSRIDSAKFLSKAKFSPFDGFQTTGVVASTIVGGRIVYCDGALTGDPGCGSVIRSGVTA